MRRGKPKKTRKLGKWVNGMDGKLTKAYSAKRKKARKTARRSRSLNHKFAKKR